MFSSRLKASFPINLNTLYVLDILSFITGSTQHLWTKIYCKRSQFIATSILKSAVRLHIKNGIVFFRNRNSSKFSEIKLQRFFLNISEAVVNSSTAAELGIGVLCFRKSFIHTLRCVDGNNSSSSGELRHSFRLHVSHSCSMWLDTRASSLSGVLEPDIYKLKE